MTIQERIATLEQQLTEWQGKRAQASEQLNQAQAAILQLTGALTFARSLLDEQPRTPPTYADPTGPPSGSPNDEPDAPHLHAVNDAN